MPGPQEVLEEGCVHPEQPSAPQPVYRLSWARLLARVFLVDVTECPACGGKMKIIAALTFAPTSTGSVWPRARHPSHLHVPALRPNSSTRANVFTFADMSAPGEKCVPAPQLAPTESSTLAQLHESSAQHPASRLHTLRHIHHVGQQSQIPFPVKEKTPFILPIRFAFDRGRPKDGPPFWHRRGT